MGEGLSENLLSGKGPSRRAETGRRTNAASKADAGTTSAKRARSRPKASCASRATSPFISCSRRYKMHVRKTRLLEPHPGASMRMRCVLHATYAFHATRNTQRKGCAVHALPLAWPAAVGCTRVSAPI